MDDHTNTKEQKWHVHVIHIDKYHQNLLKTLTFLLIKNSSNKHPSSLNIHPLKCLRFHTNLLIKQEIDQKQRTAVAMCSLIVKDTVSR